MFARSAVTLVAAAALGAGLTVAAGSADAVPVLRHCTRHLTVSPVVKGEGTATDGSVANTTFTFTISTVVVPPAGATTCVLGGLTVGVGTAPGTAGCADFEAVSSRLSWPAGNSAKRTVVVKVLPDPWVEGDETFAVRVTGTSASRPRLASASGLIVNDDVQTGPAWQPGLHCHG